MAIQYKRILLKVSGEALSGPKGTGFDEETIASICAGIKAAHDLGAQIGIVVGGGNFWRGRSSGKMDRMDADKIGMLATVMNALAVKDALRQQGVDAVVMTSSFMPQVAECFTSDKAIAALESGKVGAAGLDVVENEVGLYHKDWKNTVIHNRYIPLLRGFNNVVLTSHKAYYTDQSVDDMVHHSLLGCYYAAHNMENPFEV